jgi:hypothetical protein
MYRIFLLFATIVSFVHIIYGTPLDDYVNTPDPAFSWTLIRTYPLSTYTVYVLNMTSLKWFDGIIIAVERILCVEIILFFTFILIAINLVALYSYYRA